MFKIGILAMQGAFAKHCDAVKNTGNKALLIREPDDLYDLDGIIIPGGESTTISKLIFRSNLGDILKSEICNGLPAFGTCAGMILLAKVLYGSDQPGLSCMDITVQRNAYGRQQESFETDIEIPCIGEIPFRALFIRAPLLKKAGSNVEVLAAFEDVPVLVRQNHMLAASFHPELTGDLRVHEYFIKMIREYKDEKTDQICCTHFTA